MLPSSGYFQSVDCPFFKGGLCERPHCHFKHKKPGIDVNPPWSSVDDSTFAGAQPKDNSNHFEKSGTIPFLNDPLPTGIRSYVPTPVERSITKPGGILKAPPIKQEKVLSVPEYKPTPITQLKYNADVKPIVVTLDSPPHATSFRKRKKVDEYDPEEVRYSKKRVSFNLPEEIEIDKVENNVITLDSSEDEGEVIAKFSDDDFTDEDHNKSDDYNKIKAQTVPETNVVIKTEPEESKPIDKFSLVDKILDDVTKNEEFIRGFKKPIKKETPQPSDLKLSANESAVGSKFNSVVNIDGNATKSLQKERASEKEVVIKVEGEPQIEKSMEERTKQLDKDTVVVADKKHKTDDQTKSSTGESRKRKHDKNSNEEKSKASEHNKDKTTKKEKPKEDKKHSSSSSSSSTSKSKSSEKSKHSKDGTVKDDHKRKSTEDKSNKHSKDSQKHSVAKSKHETSKTNSHRNDDKSKHSKKPADTKEKNKHSHEESKSSRSSKDNGKHSDKTSSKKTESSSKSGSSSTSKLSVKSSSTTSKKDREKPSSKEKVSKKIQDEKISSSSVLNNKEDMRLEKHKKGENANNDSIAMDEADVDSDLDDVYHNGSDSDMDSDTLEDCLRIFNENKESSTTDDHDADFQKPATKPENIADSFSGKKRVAHQPDLCRDTVPSVSWKKERLGPAQIMHNRYLQLQENYSKKNETKDETTGINTTSKLGAHIASNVKKLLAANTNLTSTESYTPVTTIKGEKRIAHVPIVAMNPRPIIPSAYGSKVATNIRQKYLNSFIDECLKFSLTEEEAFETALEEEKNAYNRSTNKTIYLNIAANALNRLRRTAREGPPSKTVNKPSASSSVSSTTSKLELSKKTISHEMMLAGPRAQKLSYSIERKKSSKPEPELVIRGKLLYSMLSDYLLTEEQLAQNGFPFPHPTDPKRVVITGIYANKTPTSKDPFRRVCIRCSKTYFVDDEGDYTKEEECDFHWGRIYKQRIAGSIEARFTCCQGDGESDGCCVSAGHVFDGSEEHVLKGFVGTQPKTPPADKYYGVYALDCEMCYTTAGMELTRVTIIGPDMNTVFETFVKPDHRVLDYNTRFSGITADDLLGVSTSIRDVQTIITCMLNDKTILIGHSLESDFKALKLIHKTVVDTSVVFPHKLGLPYKRALRTLMAEKCRKIIQNSIGGHDSQEDAAACMELMMWKLKEDLRSSGR